MSSEPAKTATLAIWIARLIPLPFLLGGAVMLYFGAKEIHLARESVTWPFAEGTVQCSTVGCRTSSKGRRTFNADILYQFTVDGQIRKGNRIAFGVTSGRAWAEDMVKRYPTGSTVKVHYCAKAPDTCVLEPGLRHGQFWFLPTFGLFLLLSMGLMAIFFPKAIRKKEEQTRQGRDPSRVVACPNHPRPIRLRRDGQVLELTLRKNRLALLVSFVAVLLGPIFFIYIGFAVKEVPIAFGVLGIVFLAGVFVGYARATFATETIRVEADKIEVRQFSLWSGIANKVVHTSDIKGVTVTKDNNSWSVNIDIFDVETGDEMSISVGSRSWLSFATAEWIRNCILQVLATVATQRKKSL